MTAVGAHTSRRLSSERVLALLGLSLFIRLCLVVADVDAPQLSGWALAAACAWAWFHIGRGFFLEARVSGVEREIVTTAAAAAFLGCIGVLGAWAMASKAVDMPSVEPGPLFLSATGVFLVAKVVTRRRLCGPRG